MTEWEQSEKKMRLLVQIDQIYGLLGKLLASMLTALILGLLWTNLTRAASIPDIFMVPVVRLTPIGAAVIQPQTGDGYEALQIVQARNAQARAQSATNSPSIAPGSSQTINAYLNEAKITEAGKSAPLNGGSTYTAPRYDAFAEGSNSTRVYLPPPQISHVGEVDFSVRSNMSGATDQTVGTTATMFTFTANVSGGTLRQGQLQYRWDFDGDGQPDTYFSSQKSISHRFQTAGSYSVRLEVLDNQGRVSVAAKALQVVENDAPAAYFKAGAITTPQNSIIRFDTSLSYDSQYPRGSLSFRFDWDGDGQYDTNFEKKTTWNHLFREPGSYTVTMEVADPEGLTDRASLEIVVLDDSPPLAVLTVEQQGNFKYLFDAGQSTDDFTPQRLLQYRWDLNYTGRNDIVFDSGWSTSPKFSGTYRLGGSKTVRLQVRDQQGFIDEAIAVINVPWPEEYLNMAVSALQR